MLMQFKTLPLCSKLSSRNLNFLLKPKLFYRSSQRVSFNSSRALVKPMTTLNTSVPMRRSDYKESAFQIPKIEMDFDILRLDAVVLNTKLHIRRISDDDLILDGEDLLLKELSVEGKVMTSEDYCIANNKLRIPRTALPTATEFVVETTIELCPKNNLTYAGLYVDGSGTMLTQCEAHGFRRITYSLDRPDVLSLYNVSINAEKSTFPVVLSNGNLIEQHDLPLGRYHRVFEDPFPKPSYLFALVVGDLGSLQDSFTTRSGKKVDLHIYSEHKNINQLEHAMHSLKRAMSWDENVYGLEYDLGIFNIVATDSGAMENKSLNIFNTAYVQGRADMSTDNDLENILGVIGHEYFHNWTGNRVTCRDWFQLTLKEGLTVFRDQQFTQDETLSAVKRIDDVRRLRASQFPEDAGVSSLKLTFVLILFFKPMAHPIRPEEVQVQDNFYTPTVYEKGAEVIRMYHTLLGKDEFRKGMDLYFQLNDGKAVTCDDFRFAMANSCSDQFLREKFKSQYELWYSQAGTPVIQIKTRRNPNSLIVNFLQDPGATNMPFMVPICYGLIDANTGGELDSIGITSGEVYPVREGLVLLFGEKGQLRFEVSKGCKPILSAFRNFSAPVNIDFPREDEEFKYLMLHDSDPFSRYEAAQQFLFKALLDLVHVAESCKSMEHMPTLGPDIVECIKTLLQDNEEDNGIIATSITIPSFQEVLNKMDKVDPLAICQARKHMQEQIGTQLFDVLLKTFHASRVNKTYEFNPEQVGRRKLANTCLNYLSSIRPVPPEIVSLLFSQYKDADNMTVQGFALQILCDLEVPEREHALNLFENQWKENSLVMDKWFMYQASSKLPGALERVKRLMQHDKFALTNPNKLRAVIGGFCRGNPENFHSIDGSGYQFLGEIVRDVDRLNPQMGAALAKIFLSWKKFDKDRQELIQLELKQILEMDKLSANTQEVCTIGLSDKVKEGSKL